MLETAMLKVFHDGASYGECINDVFQIYGGSALLCGSSAWTNAALTRGTYQSAKGPMELLHFFYCAWVGMRGPGMEFKEIYDTMMKPSRDGMSQSVGRRKKAGFGRDDSRAGRAACKRASPRALRRQLGHLIGVLISL